MLANVRWGLRWGLLFATAFSLWVLAASLLRGSFDWPQYGTTTWGVVAAYYVAALIGGTAVGILRPLSNWRIGTFVLGWIVGSLVYGAVAVVTGIAKGGPWWLATILGLPAGGIALVTQDEDRGDTETSWRFITIVVGVGTVLVLLMYLAGWW